jgi:hypothetical protein
METQTNEPRVYKVPEINLRTLNEKIAKLNRRAAKLGVEPVTLTKVGEEQEKEVSSFLIVEDTTTKRFVATDCVPRDGEKFTGRVRLLHLFIVTGVTPKLAGWEFLGKIEVVRDEEGKVIGNLLRLVPDAVAPSEYRNIRPWCDHCNVDRRWAETFIIKHESGQHKQVGRRCLSDFLGGVSPEQVAAHAEYLLNIDGLMGDSEESEWGNGGRGKDQFDVETILELAACHIRKDGWVSRANADARMIPSTSNDVINNLTATTKEAQKQWEDYNVEDQDKKTAADTMEWLAAVSPDETNEYRYSLGLLGRAGIVNSRQVGLLCSAISAMLRDRDQEIQRRLRAEGYAMSGFVGEVKKRTTFANLTVENIRHIEGNFGTTTLYTFVDSNRNLIKWFASNTLVANYRDAEVGDVVTIKATVKAHEEYKGIKQTLITRAAVIESQITA